MSDETTVTLSAQGHEPVTMSGDEFDKAVKSIGNGQMSFEGMKIQAEINVLGKVQCMGLHGLKRGQWVTGTFEAQVVKAEFAQHPKLGGVRINHLAGEATITEIQ